MTKRRNILKSKPKLILSLHFTPESIKSNSNSWNTPYVAIKLKWHFMQLLILNLRRIKGQRSWSSDDKNVVLRRLSFNFTSVVNHLHRQLVFLMYYTLYLCNFLYICFIYNALHLSSPSVFQFMDIPVTSPNSTMCRYSIMSLQA